MSQLRAPAANRADRREGGGRHGKAAQQLPEAHIRPQLLRIAVLPAVAVSLGGAAAVLFALRSADGGETASPLLW
ncbi:ATP-binding protein, partial [Streptomyces albidoflavus]